MAEGSQTGVFREGDYEVHVKGGRVVGTFYLGFPTPPVWVAAALLFPGEGEYTFTPGVPFGEQPEPTLETPQFDGRPLFMAPFLLEGALALEEAKALAHPSSLVFVPGRAFSGPSALLPFLRLASLTALIPSLGAAVLFSRSGRFVLRKRGRVLVLRQADEA